MSESGVLRHSAGVQQPVLRDVPRALYGRLRRALEPLPPPRLSICQVGVAVIVIVGVGVDACSYARPCVRVRQSR